MNGPMSKRKVAVLGTGSIGMRHLRALADVGASPIAVPIRASRRRELGETGFATADGIEDAVHRGATALIVATDTARHVSDASASIAAGQLWLAAIVGSYYNVGP